MKILLIKQAIVTVQTIAMYLFETIAMYLFKTIAMYLFKTIAGYLFKTIAGHHPMACLDSPSYSDILFDYKVYLFAF